MTRRQHKVTMTTPLLTPDGFPRADIDVAQIRTTRARIIRLKNDYKSAMSKLEVAVQEQFASGKPLDVAQPARSQASTNGGNVDSSRGSAIEPPFAKVNTVVPNSPAEEAGLRAGDKITRFGGANWTNHERLSKVAQVVQQNENVCGHTCETRAQGSSLTVACSNVFSSRFFARGVRSLDQRQLNYNSLHAATGAVEGYSAAICYRCDADSSRRSHVPLKQTSAASIDLVLYRSAIPTHARVVMARRDSSLRRVELRQRSRPKLASYQAMMRAWPRYNASERVSGNSNRIQNMMAPTRMGVQKTITAARVKVILIFTCCVQDKCS